MVALRSLLRTPSLTALAVATLALGIGATTTIFTVVNGVLLRPLPYADPDRLAIIWNDMGQGAQSLPAVSALDFRDYKERSRTFEDFAAASGPGLVRLRGNLTGDGDPERVDLSPVTANFFPLFGASPALGRNFTAEEEQPNGPKVAILSHRLWQRRYAGDPSLVGRTIAIDGIAHEVVGILPAQFRLLLPAEAFMVTDADIWAPLQFDYGQAPPRNYTGFSVYGRLAPGVTWAQAQAEMNLIAEQFRAEFPVHAASSLRIRVVPFLHDVVKHAPACAAPPDGRGGAGPADRLRERRQPAADACHREGRGVRPSGRSGREPVGDAPPGAGGRRYDRSCGRRAGARPHFLDDVPPSRPAPRQSSQAG